MSRIKYVDTDGDKSRLLPFRYFGLDNHLSGNDVGRVYIGTGSENIPLAKKAEVDLKADKSDTYIKSEVDSFINTKADKSTTYTKTEVDSFNSTAVKITGDQTIEDVKTFTSSPVVPAPTAVDHAVNKQYVDNMVVSPNGSNSYAVAMAIVFGS